MPNWHLGNRKRFLVIAVVAIIAVLVVVSAFVINQALIEAQINTHKYPQDAIQKDSNLSVKGIVTSIEENHESQGFMVGNYHIFRFYIQLNITEIVWFGGDMEYYLSENVSDSNRFSVENKMLNGFNAVGIGYDNLDDLNLQIGQVVECKGYYVAHTDTPYSFIITVSPIISESYLKQI